MYIERMKALAQYLRTVDPLRFNMKFYWGDWSDDYRIPCGCTIGHAMHMPEFALLGFAWDAHSIDPDGKFEIFMGLTFEQCLHITHTEIELGPSQMADRIDRMATDPEYAARKVDWLTGEHAGATDAGSLTVQRTAALVSNAPAPELETA